MDVHYELYAFSSVESLPHWRSRSNLADPSPHHGIRPWWPAPLERDAVPRRAPRISGKGGHFEPAWAFSRLAESSRCRLGGLTSRLVETERRRRNVYAEAREETFTAYEK